MYAEQILRSAKASTQAKYCITKQELNKDPPPLKQWEQQLAMNQKQQNYRLKTESSLSHWWDGRGLKCILLTPKYRFMEAIVYAKH